MDSSPASSPAMPETISANLRMFLRALMVALGAWRAEPLLALVFYRRTSAAVRRIEWMLARFRAGRLWRVTQRTTSHRATEPGQQARRTPGVRLPRKFGWLVQAGGHQVACVRGPLQGVLNSPDMVELLAASAQAQRILRPLCRALAMDLPWTVDKPRAERKPRIRKPRPKPEPFRIPLPRGMLAAARRDKELEKAIKLKHETVLKMAPKRAH